MNRCTNFAALFSTNSPSAYMPLSALRPFNMEGSLSFCVTYCAFREQIRIVLHICVDYHQKFRQFHLIPISCLCINTYLLTHLIKIPVKMFIVGHFII